MFFQVPFLYSGGREGRIRKWSGTTCKLVKETKIGSPVLGLRLFFAEKLLLSWSPVGVHVFDAGELELVCVLNLGRQPSLVREQNGSLFFCLDTGQIVGWNVSSPEEHKVYKGLAGPVTDLAVAGKFLCASSADHSVRIWHMETAECWNVLRGHQVGMRFGFLDFFFLSFHFLSGC